MISVRIKKLLEIVPNSSNIKYLNEDLTLNWRGIDDLLTNSGEWNENYRQTYEKNAIKKSHLQIVKMS